MINFARCMLLNRHSNVGDLRIELGDELIPADFIPVDGPPEYVRRVRAALRLDHVDRPHANYMVRRYLRVLQATGLDGWIRAKDPRISYSLRMAAGPVHPRFGLVGTPGTLRLVGDLPAARVVESSRYAWQVYLEDGDAEPGLPGPDTDAPSLVGGKRVRIVQLSPVYREETFLLYASGGLSALYPLFGSPVFFRIPSGANGTWTVEGYAKPAVTLPDIMRNLQAEERWIFHLLGEGTPRTSVEPWATCRRLWREHPEFVWRLGGVLLALVLNMADLADLRPPQSLLRDPIDGGGGEDTPGGGPSEPPSEPPGPEEGIFGAEFGEEFA